MKFCEKCGEQLDDNATSCPRCGSAVNSGTPAPNYTAAAPAGVSTIKTVAFVFMILGCLTIGWTFIPLIWTIPMTVHYYKCTKNHLPVGTGFKICALLFVSPIGGILMLCDSTAD